ncbi:MAG TPA: hypothetical protein VNJ47_00265 [Nevskiales bacterium]|nr:hypothetical protein [Nevskiales bacterium]
MGGFGSGNTGWRPHLESALCLSLPKLRHWGYVLAGGTVTGKLIWTYGTDQYAGSIRVHANEHGGWIEMRHELRERAQSIELVAVAPPFGGVRWYMRCPYTGRRALKLYLFNGIELFCCRDAIRPRPTYASQRVSGSDRIMAQRWAIRRKLDDPGDLFTILTKPKWMRWRTFERYEQHDNALAERENVHLLRLLGRLQKKRG